MVAVQARRFDGVFGKAEMPGVEDSINSINSFWRLNVGTMVSISYPKGAAKSTELWVYRLVTL